MRGVYIGNNRILVSPVWGGKLMVNSQDLSLGPDLILHGAIEQPLTNYLIKNIKKNQIIFDLGANLGYFTTLLGFLVGPNGRIIAYEPHPELYSLLMDNLSINYLHDRTMIYKKAVYSSKTNLSFYITTRFMGNSSIHHYDKEYFKHYVDKIEEIQVEAVPLDIHLNHFKHIDLVKMDIEGGEYHAFLGMKEMIKTNFVRTIIFELNSTRLQKDWLPFTELLQELNEKYHKKFFILSPEGDLILIEINQLLARGSYPFVVMK